MRNLSRAGLIPAGLLAMACISAWAADDIVKTISHGARIDENFCVPGKFTVLEFYADW